MIVRLSRFQDLLDIHGPALARWPADRQAAARRLLAADPAARAALAAAQRLCSLLDRVPAPPAAAAPSRVAAILAQLPVQAPPRWWRAPVMLWDLLPRWPRGVALAAMAALGILVGMTDLGGAMLAGPAGAGAAASDADVSSLIFDPNPAIGLAR